MRQYQDRFGGQPPHAERSLCRALLLSSDQRMNFRGAAELLSGDDKAMQANNLAGLNE